MVSLSRPWTLVEGGRVQDAYTSHAMRWTTRKRREGDCMNGGCGVGPGTPEWCDAPVPWLSCASCVSPTSRPSPPPSSSSASTPPTARYEQQHALRPSAFVPVHSSRGRLSSVPASAAFVPLRSSRRFRPGVADPYTFVRGLIVREPPNGGNGLNTL